MVALTYGCGSAIYFAASADGGATFSPAVKVADPGMLPLGRHRGPRVAIAGNAIVVTAVDGRVGTHPGEHGKLLAWRSLDGGKTWSAPVTINDVPDAAREGLHALAGNAQGHLFAAWLDDRMKGKKLYGARSGDGGATWSKNVLLYESPDGTICQCCHPSVAMDGRRTWIMWRNCVGGSRDMYIAGSTDGVTFSKPDKLGIGSWKIDACPMDGGGIAIGGKAHVVTAWRREKTIYLALPGTPELVIGEGADAAIAYGGDGAYTAWSNKGAIELLTAAGKRKSLGPGAFPNLVALPDGKVLAAWEDGGKIVVQAP
jgi:hypothetical protein